MDCSMPGLPVHHQLPELAQTHVHWVGDAIQPSHPLSSPSPSAFNLFPVLSNQLALSIRWPKYWSISFNSLLPMNIQGWFPLGLTGLISLQCKAVSRVFSNTTVQKHQFFGTQLSLSFSILSPSVSFYSSRSPQSNPITGHIPWQNHNPKKTRVPRCSLKHYLK